MRIEKEIIENWKHKNTLVSICCVAYNQENFIEETLKSFLMQETNFAFEVLIHDDASTDKTAEIIKKYTKKYPNIIKPILQTENQFSKGKLVNLEYNLSRVNSVYIALCDGDDYWTNQEKLQKQVDFLENNSTFIGCSHNTKILEEDKNVEDRVVNNILKDIFTIEDFTKGEIYFHTSSMMYRNDKNMDKVLKYLELHRGDWYISIVFSQYGPIKYIDEVMSVYRIHDKGVWSLLNEEEKIVKNLKAIIDFNKIFDYKYEENFLNLFTRISSQNIQACEELFEGLNKEDAIKLIKVAYLNIIEKDNMIIEKDNMIIEKDNMIIEKDISINELRSSKICKIMFVLKKIYKKIGNINE
ncbi:MAG: glycosyltransferase [Sulfurimonas sp.]|nr:glycosyltransferase [Sulfurimonas sp.]